MIRGKLKVPEFKVELVDEERNKRVKDELIHVLAYLAEMSCNLSEGNEKIASDIFADLLTVIYQAPMYFSYVPYYSKSLMVNPYDYFITYLVMRHLNEEKLKALYSAIDKGDLNGVMSVLDELGKTKGLEEFLETLAIQYSDKVTDVYEALLFTPADTRPGLNSTSLVSHLEMTSLLAWMLQAGSVDLSYLRIASVFHDLGKLVDPLSHVKASSEIMGNLMEELKGSCLGKTILRVKELVEQHHGDVFSIVQKADRLASSTDRYIDVVRNTLHNVDISKCYEAGVTAEECSKIMDKMTLEEYERLSIKAYFGILSYIHGKNRAESLAKFFSDRNQIKIELPQIDNLGEEKKGERELGYFLYFDFPGIQNFIKDFPKLRDMSFASFLVGFLSSVYPFILIDKVFKEKTKTYVPAEAMLSGYGGHSQIVIRKEEGVIEEIVKRIEDDKLIKNLDLRLQMSYTIFTYDSFVREYGDIWNDIQSQAYKRYLVSFEEKVYSYGLHRTCTNCGIRPAVEEVSGDLLCERCALIRKLSKGRGFMSKLRSTYHVDKNKTVTPVEDYCETFKEDCENNDVKEAKYAMEFISGSEGDETKYVAVIKADGNDAGKIFSSSISFSDYIDKSFRTDYATKKAFREVLKGLNSKIVSRILAGVLYFGGDDLLFMVPSKISTVVVKDMFKKVEEYSGFKFKVGVSIIKPDHPIQFAIQATDELMERSKDSRNSTSLFIVSSNSLITRGTVEDDLETLKEVFIPTFRLTDLEELLKRLNIDAEKIDKDEARKLLRDLEAYIQYYNEKKNKWDTIALMIRDMVRLKDSEEKWRYLIPQFVLSKRDKDWNVPLLNVYYILKSFKVG